MKFSQFVTIVSICATSLVSTSLFAQNFDSAYFGNDQQPGNRLHTNIMGTVDKGFATIDAIKTSIDKSITRTDNTLNGEAKSAVAFDIPIANNFYAEMIDVNSLIDVVKTLIESNPEKIVHVITLGVVLYPEFAQEVYDGAALTGLMDPDDVLIAALQAGADPALVSAATASGLTSVPTVAIPIGAGIGAGGTGGGDTTASSN